MSMRGVGDVVRRTVFPISILVCLFIYFSRLCLYSPKIDFFFLFFIIIIYTVTSVSRVS